MADYRLFALLDLSQPLDRCFDAESAVYRRISGVGIQNKMLREAVLGRIC